MLYVFYYKLIIISVPALRSIVVFLKVEKCQIYMLTLHVCVINYENYCTLLLYYNKKHIDGI